MHVFKIDEFKNNICCSLVNLPNQQSLSIISTRAMPVICCDWLVEIVSAAPTDNFTSPLLPMAFMCQTIETYKLFSLTLPKCLSFYGHFCGIMGLYRNWFLCAIHHIFGVALFNSALLIQSWSDSPVVCGPTFSKAHTFSQWCFISPWRNCIGCWVVINDASLNYLHHFSRPAVHNW